MARLPVVSIHRVYLPAFCVLAYVAILPSALAQPCQPFWSDRFPLGDLNGAVRSMLEFDADGAGLNPPELFVSGLFTAAGPVTAIRAARWNGATWSPMGSGLNSPASAMTIYDRDGDGPIASVLVAGGFFSTAGGTSASRIAAWNGATWSPLGSGITAPPQDSTVAAVTVFDPDGNGPNPPLLIAGGFFDEAGGQPAFNVAAWNGSSWSPLGEGTNGTVTALTVFDEDGPGPIKPALFVGGAFSFAGGMPVSSNVARWDGASWSAVGSGLNATASEFGVFDEDGAGPNPPRLFAGGGFTLQGGSSVARWDGASWTLVGGGVSGPFPSVGSFAELDFDGPGPDEPVLIAGGEFTTAGGVSAERVAAWDGTSWSAVGGGVNNLVGALASYDLDAEGPATPVLVAGGFFSFAGGVSANRIAQWDGGQWSAFGTGQGLNGDVNALAFFDEDGAGGAQPALFAGGEFTIAGAVTANRIARWDGASWSALGPGMDNIVFALTVYDADGSGPVSPALVAGGSFQTPASRIAQWNGSSWSALGTGMDVFVSSLVVFDEDGPGPDPPALIAGGSFLNADGNPANHVARWDGISWSQMGAGLGTDPAHEVKALAVYDSDGDGPGLPVLIAGGTFTSPGFFIAEWDGQDWQPMGFGTDDHVFALAEFDDSGGAGTRSLYVGGRFGFAGGQEAIGIARWDGSSWSALPEAINNSVIALAVFDEDGAGPGSAALFAGGVLTMAGNDTVNRIARWDGVSWSPLGSGMAGSLSFGYVFALAGLDRDANGPPPTSLFAGGAFTVAGGHPSEKIGEWVGCDQPLGDVDFDGDVDALDFLLFQLCFGGANVPPADSCPPGEDATVDADADVDLDDHSILVGNMTGP